MSRRNKIIVIVAGVLLLLILFLVWWFLTNNRPSVIITNQSGFGQLPQKLPVDLPTVSGADQPAASAPVQDQQVESALKAVAKTVTERFGSYSNQSNFENFEDLQSLMTVKMKNWVNDYALAEQVKLDQNQGYYGITTLAVSVKITSFDDSAGQADITVSTQRQESRGDTSNPRIFYQNLLLKLVKTQDSWQVDEASWQ